MSSRLGTVMYRDCEHPSNAQPSTACQHNITAVSTIYCTALIANMIRIPPRNIKTTPICPPLVPTSTVNGCFPHETGLDSPPQFLLHLFWKRNSGTNFRMSFLSLVQQCRSTEGNSEHRFRLLARPRPFFIHHMTLGRMR